MPQELHIKGLDDRQRLTTEKLNFLRERKVIETDAAEQFKLDYQIRQLEQELAQIQRERTLSIGLATPSDDATLKAMIRELDLERDKIGVLYMVNCNRQTQTDEFWDNFDDRATEPFQFYFVPACPEQMPPSFAERMVWEVLLEELDEEMEAISVEMASDGLRLKTADFEIKNRLERTQKAFKKYFCKRFNEPDFEKLIEHVLPQRGYHYIATIIRVEANEWKPFLPEFLEWIMETFGKVKEGGPIHLFFTVVYLKNFVSAPIDEDQKRILVEISKILNQHENACALLQGLSPVPDDDLEKWFRDVGEQNPNKIKAVIQSVVAGLPFEKQERFKNVEQLDMADIELLQKLVYEVANE